MIIENPAFYSGLPDAIEEGEYLAVNQNLFDQPPFSAAFTVLEMEYSDGINERLASGPKLIQRQIAKGVLEGTPITPKDVLYRLAVEFTRATSPLFAGSKFSPEQLLKAEEDQNDEQLDHIVQQMLSVLNKGLSYDDKFRRSCFQMLGIESSFTILEEMIGLLGRSPCWPVYVDRAFKATGNSYTSCGFPVRRVKGLFVMPTYQSWLFQYRQELDEAARRTEVLKDIGLPEAVAGKDRPPTRSQTKGRGLPGSASPQPDPGRKSIKIPRRR